MNHENYKADQYKANFDNELIVNELNQVLANLNSEYFDIEDHKSQRGETLVAAPLRIENPFVSIKTTYTENGKRNEIKIAWTTLDQDGNIPKGVNSKTAIRDDSSKPALISLIQNVENNKDDEIEIQEVLFSNQEGFDRFIFTRGKLQEKIFFYKENGESKIYEMKRPFYINYHNNGEPKEVWYFNPKAQNFASLSCTVRASDDHPVVISFYENGEIHEVDYTGFFFVENSPREGLNFPFHSRYNYFMPSYYKYSKLNEFGQRSVVEKYNLHKKVETKDSILGVIGGWGVDISSPEIIRQQLDANPMFDDTIRNILGIAVLTDEQIDKHDMISKIKI